MVVDVAPPRFYFREDFDMGLDFGLIATAEASDYPSDPLVPAVIIASFRGGLLGLPSS